MAAPRAAFRKKNNKNGVKHSKIPSFAFIFDMKPSDTSASEAQLYETVTITDIHRNTASKHLNMNYYQI